MAKQKQKDKSAWDRFQLWVKANEKVLFVLLLAVLGFSFAFGPQITTIFQGGGQTLALGFGRKIDANEFKAFQNRAVATLGLVRVSNSSLLGAGLPTIPNTYQGLSSVDAQEMLVHLGVAKDMGLRVSEEELHVAIQRLWRGRKAAEIAAEKLGAQNLTQQQQFQLQFQMRDEMQKVLATLEEKGVFDPDEYSELVKTATRLKVSQFERTLRELLLLRKLGEYVVSTVTLDPKDVFERYNEEYQKRKFRWLELDIPQELRDEIRAEVAKDEAAVRERFEDEREAASAPTGQSQSASWMSNDTRMQFSWLRADREAFVAKVEAEITDEKLLEAYEADLARYLKPGIFPEDAGFALRTEADEKALEAKRYKPFEEVKDEVRRRYIKKTTNSELRDLATQLGTRLYPRSPPGSADRVIEAKASDFQELVDEWAKKNGELSTGTTEFATRAEAEEAYGDLYTGSARSKLDRWFNDAPANRYQLKEADQKNLKYATYIREEVDEDDEDSDLRVSSSFVFFSDVQIRGGRLPKLGDVREKIIDQIANEKLNELITTSLDKKVEAINAGTEKLADLAKGTVEVKSASGKAYTVNVGDFEAHGKDYVNRTRNSQYARVMVADTSDEAKKALEEDPNAVREVTHKSAGPLHDAAFSIEKKNGVATAPDDERGTYFIVEYLNRINPDPGDFATRRRYLEPSMLNEKQNVAFTAWKKKVYEEGGVDFGAADAAAGG